MVHATDVAVRQSASSTGASASVSAVKLHAGAVDQEVVGAGDAGEGAGVRPALANETSVRVRWRSSASVPVSTVRPARMMLTRSQRCSTSLRMWLDSSTVAPLAEDGGDLVAEDRLHERDRGRDVGSSKMYRSAGVASAAIRATFCRLPLE